MTETTNLHLTKDAETDYYSVARVNANSDKIDAFAGQVNTALSGKATPADIAFAINALNAASVGGTGKYISAISETGGVISATASQIDYTSLINKPQINSVTLTGDKSSSDLGLASASDISGKADKATTLSGYGITDAKITSGTITLGSDTITPLTQHQDISGKADKVEQEKDRAALVEIVDSGAKNLLKISGTSQTVSGVTFTVNSDGSISASGTATSDAVFNLTTNLNLQSGSYVFSPVFPNGSSGTTFFCDIFDSGYSNRSVAYQERSIPDTTKIIRFIVANGYTANNITLFPMVCTAANRKISAAFVPYRPSYQELCDRIAALEEVNANA